MNNMQRTSATLFLQSSLKQVWFSPPSLSESVSVFVILTTCFFGGMMANFDINVLLVTLCFIRVQTADTVR